MGEIRQVYRWDLDKTYLRTDFDSWRGLLRAAWEKAGAKVNVAGSAALMRELKTISGSRICIISGSPRQMRKTLEEKFRLDRVSFDEFTLKPNVENLLRGRFRALRDQVGYKLPTLLEGRKRVPATATETLFGDDAEADAFVYSLYADLVAGRVSVEELGEILRLCSVYDVDAKRTLAVAAEVEKSDPVGRIFIHLDGYTPPARFAHYGSRVVPIYNYFQAAVLLMIDGHLGPLAVVRIAAELSQGYGYSLVSLANSFQDLLRRGLARQEDVSALRLAFEAHAAVIDALRPAGDVVESFLKRIAVVAGVQERVPRMVPIDYLEILRTHGPPTSWRHKRKPRGKLPDDPFV
ncbi:hypothetical protein [Vulgatibacter sp.]|uniref:hypothetical protein n=1 Tax=Vulgatibacter sp. TaxID=1971226 RepID=UPI003565AF27